MTRLLFVALAAALVLIALLYHDNSRLKSEIKAAARQCPTAAGWRVWETEARMDGTEICRYVRNRPYGEHVMVVKLEERK